jgi:hypothetical protein
MEGSGCGAAIFTGFSVVRMQRHTKQILIHVIGALGFLSLPIFLSPDFMEGRPFWNVPGFRREMLFYCLLLGFFYLHYYVLIPRFYFQKRWWPYILLLIGCFVVVAVLPFFLISDFPPHFQPHRGLPTGDVHIPRPRPRFFFVRAVAFFASTYLIMVFFSLHLRVRNRLKEVEQERIHAQLAYLKAQINPHFLFNTLNSIYAMAIEKSEATADAVVKLSGMMRFVLSDAHREYVPLEKEINYLSDYIDLQRSRLGDTVDLQFDVEGNPIGKKIAPLILIAFIENAFKHGLNPEEDAHIQIGLRMEETRLELTVKNRKVTRADAGLPESGVGMENACERLNLLYPGRHELKIQEDENKYSVWLRIIL